MTGYREASEGKYYDSVNDQTVLDITDSSAALEQADKERLAEDLRLIYVALTRAVYGCFIGLAPLRNGRSTKEPTGVHLSAIGYLLQNGQEAGIAELHSALNAQVSDAIVVTAPPPPQSEPFTALVAEKPILKAHTLHAHIDRHWRLTSYSALVKHSSKLAYDEASLEISGFDIDSGDEQNQALLLEPERSILLRGATPGTFYTVCLKKLSLPNRPAAMRISNESLN